MCGRSSNLSAGQTAAAAASVLRGGRLSLAMKSDGRAELGMAPRPVWKSQGKHEQRDVRPGDYLSVLRLERASAILHSMHWGIDVGFDSPMYNTRCEGRAVSYRRLIGRTHCAIIAAGFWEGGQFVHHAGGEAVFLAGLYEKECCTILTTEPSPKFRRLHNRMPVVLDTPEKVRAWLSIKRFDGSADPMAQLPALYRGCDSPDLVWSRRRPQVKSEARPNGGAKQRKRSREGGGAGAALLDRVVSSFSGGGGGGTREEEEDEMLQEAMRRSMADDTTSPPGWGRGHVLGGAKIPPVPPSKPPPPAAAAAAKRRKPECIDLSAD